jgi:hypothetical protein
VDTRQGGVKAIWWMYFVSVYKNGRMKPVEIVLRRWGGGKGGSKTP